MDLPTVKRISGHKTMIMVERYAHQSGAHIAEALDKLEDRYSKDTSGASGAKADDGSIAQKTTTTLLAGQKNSA